MTYAVNSLGRSTGRKFNMAAMDRQMRAGMTTVNIAAYAQVCNVDEHVMIQHLQADSFARDQFAAWKQEVGR